MDPIIIKVSKKKEKLNVNALQILDSAYNEYMSIMTPNFSPKNSAYRLCERTFTTIFNEIVRARDLLK